MVSPIDKKTYKDFLTKHKDSMIFYILSSFLIIVDQVTKSFFLKTGNINILPFFSIHIVKNEGASFGILQGQRLFLVMISLLTIVFITYIKKKVDRAKTKKRMDKALTWVNISLSLILAGTMGNLIDRLFRGHVIDFLHFSYSWFSYPSFNIADSCIVIGASIFFVMLLKNKKLEDIIIQR